MAMKYNASTGEWEEEEESSSVGTSNLPGAMPEIAPLTTSASTSPSWSYDGGDWVRQSSNGTVEARDLAGLWNPIGRGEHAESQGYTGSAVNDQSLDKLFAYKAANPDGLNTEQQAFFNNPIVGLDSYGQGSRWGNLDLFDNQFNPQQAGALMQTGGNKFLSDADRSAGGAFNFEQSPAQQSARAGGDDGFLGLGDVGTLALLAAGGYGLGTLGGLWGGAAEGAVAGAGAFTPAAGLSYSPASSIGGVFGGTSALESSLMAGAGGAAVAGEGFDWNLGDSVGQGFSPADGLNFSPSSAINPDLGIPDFNLNSLFDQAGINGLDLPSPDAFNVFNPTDYNSLSQSLGGSGIPTETLSPDVSSLSSPEMYGPQEPMYFDDAGGGTNAMGEFVNGRGMMSPQDRIATALRGLGMERDIVAKLTQGGGKMYNFMTQPMGDQRPGIFQAPSPLNTLFRGVGALDSMNQNKEAMNYLQNARSSLDGNATNPNRDRGDFANQQWMQGVTNPMSGYGEFMGGAGREFTDQARAQAARGGKRGSYLNSGKMQSDLASLYMKNQLERQNMLRSGFEGNVDSTNTRAAYDSAMLPMIKNQNAPLYQALGNTGMQYGLSELFGGW